MPPPVNAWKRRLSLPRLKSMPEPEPEPEPAPLEDIIVKGTIIFNNEHTRTRVKAEARFAVVQHETPPQELLNLLESWQLTQPSVLISVTGSATLSMEHTLTQYVKRGLAAAARSTNAWVFSGGMDRGVMELTGQAMHEATTSKDVTPCIGVAPWRKVTHREKLWPSRGDGFSSAPSAADAGPSSVEAAAGATAAVDHVSGDLRDPVMYQKRKQNSKWSAGLDGNHTHFLLVENEKRSDWGGEIELRSSLEAEISRVYRVPLVLLVLEGGPNTYETVKSAVSQGQMVVLVKESKGAAQTICEFIEPLMHDRKRLEQDPELLRSTLERRHSEFQPIFHKYNRNMKDPQQKACLESLKSIGKRLDLLSIFSYATAAASYTFDIALLEAFVRAFKRKDKEDAQRRNARLHKKALLGPLGGAPPIHRIARGSHPALPKRVDVHDNHVEWRKPLDDYDPQRFTAQVVLDNDRAKVPEEEKGNPARGWADPDFPIDEATGERMEMPEAFLAELKQRLTYENGRVVMWDQDAQLPRNPRGRTGLAGRGVLGKWGPNHAADPIVTRYDPVRSRQLQVVVIKRKDTGDWALPGGMVDAGENVSVTVKREFMEEAAAMTTGTVYQKETNLAVIDALFKSGRVVYQGYVDDPRNTDNAWMETTAYHFHCDPTAAGMLKLHAGDDAAKVKWVDISADSDDYNNLYASHKDWVDMIEKRVRPHSVCRDQKPKSYAERVQVEDFDVLPWSEPQPDYTPPPASKTQDIVHMMRRNQVSPSSREKSDRANRTTTRQMTHRLMKVFSGKQGGSFLLRGKAPSPSPQRLNELRGVGLGSSFHGPDPDGLQERSISARKRRGSSAATAEAASSNSRQVRWGSNDSTEPFSTSGGARRSSVHDEYLRRDSNTGEVVSRDRPLIDTDKDLHQLYSNRFEASSRSRRTYEAPIEFGEPPKRMPLNPRGRTGLTGRGCLGQWGPNHMSECIITRFSPREHDIAEDKHATSKTTGTRRRGSLLWIDSGAEPHAEREVSKDGFTAAAPEPTSPAEASRSRATSEGSLVGYLFGSGTDMLAKGSELLSSWRGSPERGNGSADSTAATYGSDRRTSDNTVDDRCGSDRRTSDSFSRSRRESRESCMRHGSFGDGSHPLTAHERPSMLTARRGRSRSNTVRQRKDGMQQELEVLVFRVVKTHRLQGYGPEDDVVLAARSASPPCFSLPCFFTPDEPGCHVPPQVRAVMHNEAMKSGDLETSERLQHLLQEVFDGSSAQHIYQGYVDDARNTDNAWIETTVHHMHLSRELGGQLPFAWGVIAQPTAIWVPLREILADRESRKKLVAATDIRWFENVRGMVDREYMRPGLLQLVVRWGRNDIAEIVLRDAELQEQRVPAAVQRAFQDALERSTDRSFDIKLVETLLDHGAEAAGIFIAGLWNNVEGDSFGYCQELKRGVYDKKTKSRVRKAGAKVTTLATVMTLGERGGLHADSMQERSVARSQHSDAANKLKILHGYDSSSTLVGDGASRPSKSSDGQTDAGGNGAANKAPAAKAELAKQRAKLMTPWSEPQLRLMASLIKGFDDYGRNQPVVRYFDLMCWAIVVGSLEVAHTMWQRTRSPLRAGLIAESLCNKIKDKKKTREADLEKAANDFSDATFGVLEHISDREDARKLLTGVHGDMPTVGVSGFNKGDILDLAIHLENRKFVSHRHSMFVMEDQLYGRFKHGGAIQLLRKPLSLQLNDLSPHYETYKADVERHQLWWLLRTYSLELWHIPRTKQWAQMISMVLFVVAYCLVAFQPLCGPLNVGHYVFFGWLLSMLVQELHQLWRVGRNEYFRGVSLDRLWNRLDVAYILMMLAACFLRVCTSDLATTMFEGAHFGDAEHTDVSITGWLRHQLMDEPYPSGYGPHRSLHARNVSSDSFRLYGPSADDCEFTLLLDALRSLLGITAIPLFLRLLEFVTIDSTRLGVLLVCLREMAVDIKDWFKLVMLLSIGFSVAFSILTPNFHQGAEFQLAHSAGPLRPFDSLNVAVDFSAGGAFFLPLWALYGFFEPGELAAAPGASSFAPLVLWVYLMLAAVVFVNLLIAMFNSTYSRVHENAVEQWKMSYVHQIKAYIRQYPAPPPLNVPCLLVENVWGLCTATWRTLHRRCYRVAPEVKEGPADELTAFQAETMEKQAMAMFLQERKKKRAKEKHGGGAIFKGFTPLDENVVSKLERIYEWVEQRREASDDGVMNLRDVKHRNGRASSACTTPRGSCRPSRESRESSQSNSWTTGRKSADDRSSDGRSSMGHVSMGHERPGPGPRKLERDFSSSSAPGGAIPQLRSSQLSPAAIGGTDADSEADVLASLCNSDALSSTFRSDASTNSDDETLCRSTFSSAELSARLTQQQAQQQQGADMAEIKLQLAQLERILTARSESAAGGGGAGGGGAGNAGDPSSAAAEGVVAVAAAAASVGSEATWQPEAKREGTLTSILQRREGCASSASRQYGERWTQVRQHVRRCRFAGDTSPLLRSPPPPDATTTAGAVSAEVVPPSPAPSWPVSAAEAAQAAGAVQDGAAVAPAADPAAAPSTPATVMPRGERPPPVTTPSPMGAPPPQRGSATTQLPRPANTPHVLGVGKDGRKLIHM